MATEVRAASEDDPIRKFQNEIKQLALSADALRPIVRACEDAIERSGAKARISVGTKGSLLPKVEIIVACENLDENIPLFRELAKEGIRSDKDKPPTDRSLFGILGVREYALGPQVMLYAMLVGSSDPLEDDGPKCRMEQVGVKEVPVYEVRCD